MGLGVVFCWSLGLLLIDVTRHRLPDALTLPACLVAAVACLVRPSAFWGVIWPACYLLFGRGIGGGDIKLALPLGVAVALSAGPAGVVAAMGLSALFTAVIALALRRQAVAHGPSMIVAAWLVSFNALFLGAL